MTNKEIITVALEQSAIDSSCNAKDFLADCNRVVTSKQNEKARRYLKLPFDCDLVSYGNNIVASVLNEEIYSIVESYINKYDVSHCFETPNMQVLNDELLKKDMKICFMAEYFLPDVEAVNLAVQQSFQVEKDYLVKVLTPDEFTYLYTNDWTNALCEARRHLDVLAVGAYDKESGKLVGLAGCSADCDTMWQIGIDVLKDYRKNGIATALTSRLALEVMNREKVPFYCAAWSNIKSVRNAIKSGFRPAWVELTAKSSKFVDDINKV